MSIVELINHVGAENIQVQFLGECFKSADYVKKEKAVKISFMTRAIGVGDLLTGNFGGKIGIILWLPENKMPPLLVKPT